MNFNETFSKVLRELPTKDYEKRIFNLHSYLKNGHLQ